MSYLKIFITRLIRVFYVLFLIFPIKNKILICSFGGKNYNDNPKYVAEEIKKRYPDYQIVCLLNNLDTQVPSYVTKVKNHSIKMFFSYATSKIWISNAQLPLFVFKRKRQCYIETWHGGFALKKIGMAMQDITEYGKAFVKYGGTQADYMISNSNFCSEMYRRDFLYSGKILEVGTPRLDDFLNPEIKVDVYSALGIKQGIHLAIYAPTFRDDGRVDVFDLDFKSVKKSLEETFGGEWAILLRFHPLMQDYSKEIKYSDWLIDATSIADIYAILKNVEIMITDYSSLGFDFGLLGKKIFLYAKDVEEYVKERGMYFNILDLPFILCRNNDDINDAIHNFDEEKYQSELSDFYKQLGCKEEGNASKKIVDYLELNTQLFS